MADLSRIKNNVRKMVQQNAPEADIDGYIASEGVTIDDVRNFRPAGHNVPEFVPPGVEGYDPATGEVTRQPRGRLASAAHGAADIATFGFGDELASTLGSAITGTPRDQVLSEMRGLQVEAQADNPGSFLAGQIAGGIAGASGLARSGLSLSANAALAGHGLGRTAIASAIEGAILGGVHGAGSGEDAQSRVASGTTGLVGGGILGGAAPFAIAGASNAVRRAITPFATSPERTAAANLLTREGVPLTAGQRTGSRGLRFAESELGGAKAADLVEQQAEAFTDAAMRRAGASGRATSDNMAALADRLGQGFDDISARNVLRVDRGVLNDMNAAAREYARVLPAEQRAIFGNLGDDIISKFKVGNNAMSGKDYQTIRSRLTRMAANNRQRDPDFAAAIRGLRDALDNGMERSINPADAGAWGELRRQYGNMKVLERAATGGGENSALGLISPAQLRMAASSGNRGAFARGQGDFSELAKAGQAVMSPLPDSGTASRTAVRNLGSPLLAGGGALAGGVPGLLAGLLAPRAAGAALMSKPVQRYLANQAVTGTTLSPEARAIANLLLNAGGAATAGRIGP